MKQGSIVTLKKGVQFSDQYKLTLIFRAGIKRLPVHGQPYVVEDMETFFCENCKKEHTYIAIDNVGTNKICWDSEDFEELQPPQEIQLDELIKEPMKIVGEGAESIEELMEI